jgi:hypothetical protein
MEEKTENKTTKLIARVHVAIISLTLTLFGLLFFFMPQKSLSVSEKRELAKMPDFSTEALFNGSYTAQIDLYFSDNFPFRENFVDFSFWFRRQFGYSSDSAILYKDVKVFEAEEWMQEDTALLSYIADSLDVVGEIEGSHDGIIIYNGMAITIFGGSDGMAKFYASVINKYGDALKGTVNIYNIVIPSGSDLYLARKMTNLEGREKKNIGIIAENLNSGIKNVDAYTPLWNHRNEYLYFRSDHHWTALGAYYVYAAFCAKAGITAVELSSLGKKVKKNFLGSLYQLVKDPVLLANPDSVVYYTFPGNIKVQAHRAGYTKTIEVPLLVQSSSGGGAYNVFLGGDYPMLEIETGITNGKKVLVVKNSYGNPFVPFLVSHYEKIWVVDYRYYKKGLIPLIVDNEINDLIFINSVFMCNTKFHVAKIQKVMYYNGEEVKVKTDSTLLETQDSIRVNNIFVKPDSINSALPDSLKN